MPTENKKRLMMADQADGLLSPWLRKQRINMACPYIKGRILDYGCGVGVLSEKCHPDSYLGVDMDEESLGIAFKRYPAFRFANTLPEDEKFDVIILLAVIEHLTNLESSLKELKKMLVPDGQIIVTTPLPMIKYVHFLGSRIGLFSLGANEDHEHFFELNSMKKLATKAGLDVLEYKRFLFGMNQLFILRSQDRPETLY